MRKSTSYRETFRQHRRLLISPIIIAVLFGAWFVLGAPKSYQSTASLWVDSPASADSSMGDLNPALTPPSQQEQNVVTELLSTRSFVLQVGHQSLLAQYLAHNSSSGFGPTALLGKLGGGGNLNERIIGAIGPKQAVTTMPGPQVLQVSFTGPTPAVAQSTLRALVAVLQQDSAAYSNAHSQAALGYYKGQVQSATQAVSAARNQENQYLRQHPGTPPSNPNLSALTAAVTNASNQLTQANTNLSAAASGASGSTSSVEVIDPPSVPLGPASGKKKDLEGVMGGLVAGLLISFLGTIALTRRESDPWEDEIAEGHVTPLPRPVPTPVPDHSGPAASVAGAGREGAVAAAGNGWSHHQPAEGLFVTGRRFVRGPEGDQS